MPNKAIHHSKHSVWGKFNENHHDQTAIADYQYQQDQFSVKGNLTDEVITNPILNNSRLFVELSVKNGFCDLL